VEVLEGVAFGDERERGEVGVCHGVGVRSTNSWVDPRGHPQRRHPAKPRKIVMARFKRTISSSASLPMHVPSFPFGIVVSLSTISREVVRPAGTPAADQPGALSRRPGAERAVAPGGGGAR